MANEDITLPVRGDVGIDNVRVIHDLARALVPDGVTEVAFHDLDETLAEAGFAESNGAATTLMVRCILALGAKLVP